MPSQIGNSVTSDYTGSISDLSVPSKTTDGISGDSETIWQNSEWAKQYGHFFKNRDTRLSIILKSIWVVGKGYDCDTMTKVILSHINGVGCETFTDILFNLKSTAMIGGDSFAEIVRDSEGNLINLKVLDPSSVKIIYGKNGLIKKYTQTAKGKEIDFEPKEIFHLMHNRIADSVHGLSDIDEDTIQADEESFKDIKVLMHHQAKPFILWKLKTNDVTKINQFVAKVNSVRNLSEDLFIPDDENVLSWEVIQANPSQAVFQWREEIRNKFYRTVGMPQIIPGATGGVTESSGKMAYLGFEQIVAFEQRQIEEQLWNQLQIKVKLIPPTSLTENLQQDEAKDGMSNLNNQPADITAGVGK